MCCVKPISLCRYMVKYEEKREMLTIDRFPWPKGLEKKEL